MSDIRTLFLAGASGAGKTYTVEQIPDPVLERVAVFDFDHLMHDAVLTAFPYFVGGKHRWSKDIWEDTKRFVDGSSAMIRTIRQLHRYKKEAAGKYDCALFYGYQFADDHWRDAAKRIIGELTGRKVRLRICWLNPPMETVLQQRKNRRDNMSEEDMRKSYSDYSNKMQERYDSVASNTSEALEQIYTFFGMCDACA